MRITLKTKTALFTTLLVLLLVGATGLWQYRQLSSEYVSLMQERQQELTDVAAADLDYKLNMHLGVLARAAGRATAQTFTDASARQHFFADNTLRPMFDGAALVGLDGQVLVNDPPLEKPLSIADRDYFQRAVSSAALATSAPLLSRSNQRPAIVILAPAKNAEGQLLGLVGGGLTLDRPNVLGDIAHKHVSDGGYYMVMTRGPAPVFITHPDAAHLLQPTGSWVNAPGADTSRDLVTRAVIPSTDWELAVVGPARIAYAPLDGPARRCCCRCSGWRWCAACSPPLARPG